MSNQTKTYYRTMGSVFFNTGKRGMLNMDEDCMLFEYELRFKTYTEVSKRFLNPDMTCSYGKLPKRRSFEKPDD